MSELAEKDRNIKTTTTAVFYILKKSRDMDIKLLEIKTEMKTKLDGVIWKLQKKNISEPDGIATETFHNETKETPVLKNE